MPWKLWVAVSGLLSLDLALLIIWFAVDPLVRQVHNFPKIPSENPEEDVEIQPQMEHCKSQHHTVWLGKLKTKRPERLSPVENIVADYLCLARELTYSLTIYDIIKSANFK